MAEPAERQDPTHDPATIERKHLAEERQRLADERERLADERERTADEQERLADERERLADLVERTGDSSFGPDQTAAWARDQLLRADARVQRSLAEQERARMAVERIALQDQRARARSDRERAAAGANDLEGDEAAWASDRRAFVAADRDVVAHHRDAEAEQRDAVALVREREADDRDRSTRQRETLTARAGKTTRPGTSDGRDVDLAARDLADARQSTRLQRATAGEARHRAATDRAEAGRQRALTKSADPYAWLAAELRSLSAELFVSQDLFAVAERVAALSTECIPGAAASGITFFEGVRPLNYATTDEIARRLDAHQIEHADGPILASVELGEPVLVTDLAGEARWPSFRTVAGDLGIAGVIACELAVRRGADWQSLGALTIYAETPDALNDESGHAAALFAAHLSIATAFDRDRHDVVRREAALHRALGSRDVIGQAKGILMERQHLTAGDAYDILRRSSQQLNVKLSEVATRLTETGELPQ